MEEEMEYYDIKDKNASWQDKRREVIYNQAKEIQARGGDSLGSQSELVDFASGLYRSYEVNAFVSDLGCIIVGYCGGDPGKVYEVGTVADFKKGKYWLNYNFFTGKGSWSSKYYDYTDNQMYHFWFYVVLTYYDGPLYTIAGTMRHGDLPFSPLADPALGNQNDNSSQDYNLTIEGMRLAQYLNNGTVNIVEVGSWISGQLSQPSHGSIRPH